MSFTTAALPARPAIRPSQCRPQAVEEGKTENLCALRAQSNAYTEFVGALGNKISENTVEPGSGEDQCDDSEAQDEKRVELGAERGLSDGFAKSLHVGDRQIAIHGVDHTLNGYGERFDVVSGAN